MQIRRLKTACHPDGSPPLRIYSGGPPCHQRIADDLLTKFTSNKRFLINPGTFLSKQLTEHPKLLKSTLMINKNQFKNSLFDNSGIHTTVLLLTPPQNKHLRTEFKKDLITPILSKTITRRCRYNYSLIYFSDVPYSDTSRITPCTKAYPLSSSSASLLITPEFSGITIVRCLESI